MSKTRAYTSQFGNEQVTAQLVGKDRNERYGGRPTGKTYYSTHRPGQRKAVKHVMKDSWFFAYIESGDSDTASDGESLNHILFKEALRIVEKTKLILSRSVEGKPTWWCEVPVTITHAETEKAIARQAGSPFHADVYWQFSAEHWLATKWEKKLYLEVFDTHYVEADKQIELRALELPVIEVDIPEVFIYRVRDEDTDDEKEEAHRQRIKRTLEGENGFLRAKVLSNPSTKEFLRGLVSARDKRIEALYATNAQITKQLADSVVAEKSAVSASIRLKEQAETSYASLQATRADAKSSKKQSDDRIAELMRQRKVLRWCCGALAAGFAIAVLIGVLLL